MDDRRSSLAAYFRQQSELGIPSYIFSDTFNIATVLPGKKNGDTTSKHSSPVATMSLVKNAPPKNPAAPKRTARPLPASAIMAQKNSAPLAGKRALLAELFHQVKTCRNCGLGDSRKNFVFGTGNAEALFMVIGEAPGQEEDLQGLPFVGAAGELLTRMLAAIDIDRKKHVFITNVLKCRPPQNRNPETAEISACAGILARQMEIISPKVILLLGRTAAHALLDSADSIGKLRGRTHDYKGVPVFVTYHPAALLRNDSYRRPTWEDLQKLQLTLRDAGVYDAQAK
jgi:DNA polymerase